MKCRKQIITAVMAGLMTFGTFGGAFAAGLGTVDMSALMQRHPKFAQTMATWQNDVKKAQVSFQSEAKNTTDKNAQQALIQKYNTQLNQQRIALFGPLEKDILVKTNQVKAEKGLDYVVLRGAVVSGQSTDITSDVASKL
jgi:outer membrane protein